MQSFLPSFKNRYGRQPFCAYGGRNSQSFQRQKGASGTSHFKPCTIKIRKGIGTVKAIQIKCIGELSKRIAQTTARKGLQFTQPGTIADYYMERLRHKEQEELICMMLDTKNHLLGEEMIFKAAYETVLSSAQERYS